MSVNMELIYQVFKGTARRKNGVKTDKGHREYALPLAHIFLSRLARKVQGLLDHGWEFELALNRIMDAYKLHDEERDLCRAALGSYFGRKAYLIKRLRDAGVIPPKRHRINKPRKRTKHVRLEEHGQLGWKL